MLVRSSKVRTLTAVAISLLLCAGCSESQNSPEEDRDPEAATVVPDEPELASETFEGTFSSDSIGAVPRDIPSTWPSELEAAVPDGTFVALSGIDGNLIAFGADGPLSRRRFSHDVLADVHVGRGVIALGRSTPVLYGFTKDLELESAAALPGSFDATYTGAALEPLSGGRYLVGYSSKGATYVREFHLSSGFGPSVQVAPHGLVHMNVCALDSTTVLLTTNTAIVRVDLAIGTSETVLEVPEGVGGMACSGDEFIVAGYDSGTGYSSLDAMTWDRSANSFPSGTRTLEEFAGRFIRVSVTGSAQICSFPAGSCDPDLPGGGHLAVQSRGEQAAVLGIDGRVVVLEPDGSTRELTLADAEGQLAG